MRKGNRKRIFFLKKDRVSFITSIDSESKGKSDSSLGDKTIFVLSVVIP